LGCALVYIISLAHEGEATDVDRDPEAVSASAAGGKLDDDKRRDHRHSKLPSIIRL
jgi:hypothetical protein